MLTYRFQRIIYNKRTVKVLGKLSGCRLIHVVYYNGNAQGLRTLIDLGADLTVKTDGGETPLDICCELGKRDCVEYLFKIDDSVKDFPNDNHYSPLLLALSKFDKSVTESAYFETIKFLLNVGCSHNKGSNPVGYPLNEAARKWGDARTVELLIQAGGDVNTEHVNTPPLLAVLDGIET